MNDVTPVESRGGYKSVELVPSGAGAALLPKSLGELVAFAEVMGKADIALPKFLRGNTGACLAVSMQALRWEMDPFAVANKAYSVNDRLAYEAQLIAAVIHMRAPIRGRPVYEFSGEAEKRICVVSVTTLDGEICDYTSPEIGRINPKNSPLWKTDPDQQLGYYSIRALSRRHFPELILGVYDREEVEAMRDVTPEKSGVMERLETHAALGDGGFKDGGVETALGEVEVIVDQPKATEPKRRGRPRKVQVQEEAPPAAEATPAPAEVADDAELGESQPISDASLDFDDEEGSPDDEIEVAEWLHAAVAPMRDVTQWSEIKAILRHAATTEAYKASPPEERAQLRNAAYNRWALLERDDAADIADDHALFCLWMEFGATAEQIDEQWPRYFKRAYARSNATNKAYASNLMARRKKELASA